MNGSKSRKRKYPESSTSSSYPYGFSHVGGLCEQIDVLREMILFPLIYEDVYEMFSVKPARGVLFHGPPGTGKTLVAGALAGECLKEAGGKVTFYSHKGADILDKWVGESEQKLRNAFALAEKNQPSIIFFDELDGLAPIRSSRNDHIHISIVATLLSLMDGLNNKCGVIIIGATNRLDAIDPALRRPGRFDRELYFPLPSLTARFEILKVQVREWADKPSDALLQEIAEMTIGCNGADLKSICSGAVVSCIKRNQPINLESNGSSRKTQLKNMKIVPEDFINACGALKPRWLRTQKTMAQPLPIYLQPLLKKFVDNLFESLYLLCPHFMEPSGGLEKITHSFRYSLNSQKRHLRYIILQGGVGQAQDERIAPALLHRLEHMPCTILDVSSIYGKSMSTEGACLKVFDAAKTVIPGILYIKNLGSWWDVVDDSTRMVFVQTIQSMDPYMPLLILITTTTELPKVLSNHFDPLENIVIKITNPSILDRGDFFSPLFNGIMTLTPSVFKTRSENVGKARASTFSLMCMENAQNQAKSGCNPNTCLIESELFDKVKHNSTCGLL
ncbi:ATPase family AAA domain-containing protein 2-like [Ctenocephalides felis]|uniref:ATPase family AAA domain-containing protein 2-like n=1 Tax=Ctenocephalides felis TaxID=7515 RepID=UPI000E6E5733|nr:ATPase family AAA domain-containing protein 2-like [Ctenocephalides felis]